MSFNQERVFQRARELALNALLALGKRTISGMLSAGGKESQDWTAAYRIFEKGRISPKELFSPALDKVLENTGKQGPLFTMMDDTLVPNGAKEYRSKLKKGSAGASLPQTSMWGQRVPADISRIAGYRSRWPRAAYLWDFIAPS